MTTRPPSGNSTFDMVRQLLDRGYAQAAGTVLRTIQHNGTTGIMAQRLAELDAEAQRLTEAGERLTAENAILRALLADFDDVMRANRVLVSAAAGDVQASGSAVAGESVRQLALRGVSDQMLAQVGVAWNRPDPEAVARLVDYTTSAEWITRLDRYGEGVGTLAQQQAVRGIVQGWGPLRTASALRQTVTSLPAAYANTMMRTLQITSYRDAQVAHRVANSHIITQHIRIAALDDRTCMACIALHGTVLRPDERVDDHHSGRCDSVSVVVGREAPQVETGEDWFERQPADRQRALMGNAAFEAWQDGAIRLRDFPQTSSDPVFGQMVQAASLKGMLGPQAARYYGRHE